MDPYPHPDPHQSDKLNQELYPDPQQFSDDKPKCMEYEPILALFSRVVLIELLPYRTPT